MREISKMLTLDVGKETLTFRISKLDAFSGARLLKLLMPYLPLLEHFGMQTLGDVERFIADHQEAAYQLALSQLAITDIDILSESVGLQNLCFVYILKKGGNASDLRFVFDTVNGQQPSNTLLAENIMNLAKNLKI